MNKHTLPGRLASYALGANKPIISLKLERRDPPGFISHEQALRGDIDNPDACAKLLYPLIAKAIGGSVCSCIVDCAGLHEIATIKSNNLKQLFFDRLSSGVIAVPAIVLKEFRELYEEEAEVLEPYIAKKIVMKREYHAGAARIADSLNSGFLLNLLESCGIIAQNTSNVLVGTLAVSPEIVIPPGAEFKEGAKLLPTLISEWGKKSTLPPTTQKSLRDLEQQG